MKLCADIGGTKTLLGLAEVSAAGSMELRCTRRYLAREHPEFAPLLTRFLEDARRDLGRPPEVDAACLGVAGPVVGRRIQMTNLAWVLDAEDIGRQLGGCPVRLVNDFEAAAYGIDALGANQRLPLQTARALDRAPQLVIGAGSGLGVAMRFWNGSRYQVVSGEGGHIGFSALDAEQDRLMPHLRRDRARVVVEHVVSGPGLANLYEALCALEGQPSPPARGEDVYARAQQGEALALRAVDHFLRSYGSVAGDYALAILARGGVFVAGGIAQRWQPWMQDGRFRRSFCAKGPYEAVMQSMPVDLVTEPQLGLLGASVLAASPDMDDGTSTAP